GEACVATVAITCTLWACASEGLLDLTVSARGDTPPRCSRDPVCMTFGASALIAAAQLLGPSAPKFPNCRRGRRGTPCASRPSERNGGRDGRRRRIRVVLHARADPRAGRLQLGRVHDGGGQGHGR